MDKNNHKQKSIVKELTPNKKNLEPTLDVMSPNNSEEIKGEPDLIVVNLDKGKVVAQFDKESRISDILESFKILDGIYKRQQIDAAIELKEEITPYLIKILKEVLNNPAEYIENEDNYDHIYALFLLGHFREHRAHQIIADLFSLPDEIPDKLFGDTVTEDLAIILYRTCGSSLELIKSLALNKKAYQYCRSSALRAIEFAVVDGLVSREEIMSFLEPLLFDDDFNDGTDFLYFVARTICHLYPEGFMEKIKKAFDDEIIDPWMIGYESFEKALQDGEEKCLEKVKKELRYRSLDDLHSRMSWWACFKSEEKAIASSLKIEKASNSDLAVKSRKKSKRNKAKANRKGKKKQSKASKKKNRR